MAGRNTTKRASQSKRVAQLFYIFLGFLLILVGKADILVVRTAQNDISELFAPLFDVVSAPVRAVETMFEGCALSLLCVRRPCIFALKMTV